MNPLDRIRDIFGVDYNNINVGVEYGPIGDIFTGSTGEVYDEVVADSIRSFVSDVQLQLDNNDWYAATDLIMNSNQSLPDVTMVLYYDIWIPMMLQWVNSKPLDGDNYIQSKKV